MLNKGVVLAALLLSLILYACISTHFELPPNSDDLIRKGEVLYIEYCADCHQADGRGWADLYPNFAGNPIITLSDPSPIIETVLYGQGSMPPFNERLNPDQLSMILSYIRNAWGNQASAVSPRQIH